MNTQHYSPTLAECAPLPRLTPEQERALIERARAGEDVRDQIILSLQRRIGALAAKYARPEEQEDHADLVNSANVALLKHYQRALKHPNPYAYLLRTAQSTMINYYHGYGEHTQRERVPLLSLDEPHGENGAALTDLVSTEHSLEHSSFLEGATTTFLRQTIATLPVKQRLVIERHYGIGRVPEPLNGINDETSPTQPHSMNAFYHHKKALTALRIALAAQFPQFAEGGVK
ncbi:MAG: sigma-70 family RNA polymerase sigma factor [Ktedonobacteraceae bacterium]|nr:sigma-70 family RNA polymerase sigma factor [Ktedonobacteraceae bacterium]